MFILFSPVTGILGTSAYQDRSPNEKPHLSADRRGLLTVGLLGLGASPIGYQVQI